MSLEKANLAAIDNSRYFQTKVVIYNLIEKKTAPHNWSKMFHTFMITLILLNVGMVIMETVEDFVTEYGTYCHLFEAFTVAIFSIEYALRVWCCNVHEKWQGTMGRLKFMATPLMVIDLLVILPFFLPMIFTMDLIYLRALRLTRLFRLFKLAHYSDAFGVILRVIRAKAEYLVLSLIFILTLLIISASVMYLIEHDAQPKVFCSIPHTMWWAIVTLTTVGYGDAYPITPLGKLMSGIIAILGVALFTLPAAILSAGFFEEVQCKGDNKVVCPFCGNTIDGDDLEEKHEKHKEIRKAG